MTTRTLRRLSPLLVVPALMVSLAACSGDDGDDGDDGATGDSPTEETTTPNTISPPDLPDEPKVKKAKGAFKDVEWNQAECPTAAGEQSTQGTLENPTDDPVDYAITISWTNDTSDVLARGVVIKRDVAPGESVEWSVDAQVAEGATMCVLKAERGNVVSKG